jgi:NADPH-ferrihemoprotein reductase
MDLKLEQQRIMLRRSQKRQKLVTDYPPSFVIQKSKSTLCTPLPLLPRVSARVNDRKLIPMTRRYDFENLDQVPADSLVVFCVATYGEGESTDNAVAMMDFLKEDEPSFSNGGDLSNLNYVIFALGNSTYEQYCEVGKVIDARLSKFGATRVGERGEGDDDKSMEEDYLAWKDPMWEAVQTRMDWQEGEGGDSADFEVTELAAEVTDESKVFKGELSMRALTGTRGVYDAKNPYISPLVSSRELFDDGDRNCIFAEFDITDSGLRYQTGDHVGLWPLNPECQVERALRMVGLLERKDQVIDVKSLDPALAKVPFPVPTTYDTVFRHYLDICATASRQNVGALAKFAPHDSARLTLERLGSDKAYYHSVVAERSLKLADVLELADDGANSTWAIPFDRIISSMPRLQPRYYSISSSPKLHPNSIHITAVVLKYKPHAESTNHSYGVGTNYLLNLKTAQAGGRGSREADAPVYSLQGPRGKYAREDGGVSAPIHVRRSTFRLPTSPKVPVVMIGPGTVCFSSSHVVILDIDY